MTSTTEQPMVAETDAENFDHPVRYPAGVLAHGLHALAHHIGLYKLDYIRAESYPEVIDDRPVLEVHVDRHFLDAWLETVTVDQEIRDDENLGVRRFVRLPDSGVRVSLLTIEWSVTA
jgi:hypothetical protein